MEPGQVLPKTGAVTLQPQWVRCGKSGCRCATGDLHGPHWYLFYRVEGRQHKRYVRQRDVVAVRAILDRRRAQVNSERAVRERSFNFMRERSEQLREVERCLTTNDR